MDSQPRTLVDLLQQRAAADGSALAYVFTEDGEDGRASLSYLDLDSRARAVAAELADAGAAGERALLLYPPGLEFVAAFFGCLYAGVTAVPAYPPRLNRPMPRIQAIVRDADARFALTDSRILGSVEKRFEHEPLLETLRWRDTTRIPDGRGAGWSPERIDPDRLAFLQYTSGSTSAPKGVMLTHANLMHNLEMIRRGFQLGAGERGLFWLPSYHDMGLIGGILEPLYIAGPTMLISPVAFLQRPLRWLQGITEFRATITGAPNFAFDLCVEKITAEQRESLDLSSLRLCFTGAEPIRTATMDRFKAAFADAGYRERTLYPCYGLAEATLLVAGGEGPGNQVRLQLDRKALQGNRVELLEGEAAQEFVGCGRALFGEEIRIVDPESAVPLAEGEIGEIWVAGPHVAQGYWGRPELSRAVFGAHISGDSGGPYLRTGDLGFLQDGELFVTGRLKDLIIIRGRNHYPQDIEETAGEAHEAIEKTAVAAFSCEIGGQEALVVAAELNRKHRSPDLDKVLTSLRRAVGTEHGLQPGAVVLVRPLSIPKTTSGKIKRQATKQAYLKGELSVFGAWEAGDAPGAAAVPARSEIGREPVLAWITRRLAARLAVPQGQIDPDEPFAAYGLDSAEAVGLTAELEDFLGRTLSPTLAWDFPTPRLLAAHLAGTAEAVPSPSTPAAPASPDEAVAVIGMACRFPGADSPEALWDLLANGIDAVREVPADRFNVDAVYDPDPAAPGRLSTRWGGFLNGIDGFDPDFFGISPREAARMDPQQRLLLEVAWEALESAGLPPGNLSGTSAGVFIGISSYDYSRAQFADPGLLDAYAGTGNAHSIAANRLSYFFDLRGPSVAVDTACSSSLVAVHMACRSLLSGESGLAFAGGVNLVLSPELTITFSQARMLAPDGRCKTFDAAADGYVRGEGCGVVVLKRLSEALRDGDSIMAVIRGSAVNQDGRSNGLTAPNGPSQEAVIRAALALAGVGPHEIGYVEAHGTGTPLGDPIELHALRNALAAGRSPDAPLRVGSVKTNIGHLEAAAGIAGLIKAALVLQRGAVPPHLHLREINPYISLDGAPIRIPTRLESWPSEDRPRLAGVSSFGFGGTNAHVVLEQAPQPEAAEAPGRLSRPASLLALSARTPAALADLSRRWLAAEISDVSGAARTSQLGRRHFSHRLAVAAETPGDLVSGLEAFLARPEPVESGQPRIAFLFTGQGAQIPGMTRELYDADPIYRQVLQECSALAEPHLGRSLLDLIFSAGDRIHETRYAQPALFAVEYAMARMWAAWGIEPDILLGHSIGEWTAACLAGVVDLPQAIEIVAARGRLMQAAPGRGGMLAVAAAEADAAEALAPYANQLSIAAVNGPRSLTVSGDLDALRRAEADFSARGWKTRRLPVSHGFHSPLMDPVLEPFGELLAGMPLHAPRIPIAANLDGRLRAGPEPLGADYWTSHVRSPIRFADGVATLLAEQVDTFVEIGPRPTLLGLVRRILAGDSGERALLPTADDASGDWRTALESLGRLYELGASVDWAGFNRGFPAQGVSLPSYPFQRTRHWIDAPGISRPGQVPLGTGFTRLPVAVPIFETTLHEAPDQPGLLELALAASREFLGEAARIEQVRFREISETSLPGKVQVSFAPQEDGRVQFGVHLPRGGGWEAAAEGTLAAPASPPGPPAKLEKIEASPGPLSRANGGSARPPGVAGPAAFLRRQLAAVLGVDPEKLREDRPLNQLGLDSLMAMELRSAIEKEFGVSFPIVRLLEGPTLQSLAGLVGDLAARAVPVEAPEASNPSGPHPLTYGQQALFFLHELTSDDGGFNIAGAARITGEIDQPSLAAAFEAVMQRHPALRTTISVENGEPVQQVRDGLDVPLVEVDARAWSEERLALYLKKEAWRKFSLQDGPPFRVRLLRRGGPEGAASIVLFSVDHIVADFWSVSILLRDLLAAYAGEGLPPDVPALTFGEAAAGLNARIDGEAGEALRAYWLAQFSGGVPALDLPTDHPRRPGQTFLGETVYRRLPQDLSEKLQALAREQGTTLFNVLLAGFESLLHRYTGQKAFAVGSVLAGRERSELEGLVGYLVNPVALKADFSGTPRFSDVLDRTRRTVLEAFEHQAYPPALLADQLGAARDRSRPPLFETMFIFQKAQVLDRAGLSAFAVGLPGAVVRTAGLELEILPLEGGPAQFDLTLMMAAAEESLLASLQFNRDLFDPASADRLLRHLERLLEAAVANPEREIADLPMISPEERAEIDRWNRAAARPYPPDQTVVSMFAGQAERHAEKTAVRVNSRLLTYAELEALADGVASRLIAAGVGAGDLVGVRLRRSHLLPAALLGVLRAGGAYVPLDPAFPQARLDMMIADSGLRFVLTEPDFMGRHPASVKVFDIHALTAQANGPSPASRSPGPEDLAYVIYTSGSTGRPKGVQVTHGALANFLQAMQERPGISSEDTLLAVTTLSFDIAGLEMFLPLVSGAELVVAGEDTVRDGEALASALEEAGITILQATPSTWQLLLAAGWKGRPGLKALCGGEVMPRALAAALLELGAELWNMYGPTETTIWSTTQRVRDAGGPIGIGTPIANTEIYILDDGGALLPPGVFGELCIGGLGLARGYLDRPELTAEKFIEFDGARVYRTGDVARLLPDGSLEFAGRRDSQVKVRGYRIELGEIEAGMDAFPGVRRSAAAVVGEGAEARLVGYAELNGGTDALDRAALRRALAEQLPEYMVPAQVVVLPALPLTPNGKVDRKALPLPETARRTVETAYQAPGNETEARLAGLAAEALGLERVGVTDDFFNLGGTSLQATRLVFQVREAFGVRVELRRLFEEPTVAGLARAVEAARERGGSFGLLEPVPVSDLLAEARLDDGIAAAGRTWEPADPTRILLTGATGYLGAFLLRELLERTEADVICLVRAGGEAQAMARLQENLGRYGLWESGLGARVLPLPGDLGLPHFGLGDAGFQELAQSVDRILHNGAMVNFIQPLAGHLTSNVLGTREVLRLASTGALKPVDFVSTLSVFHTGDHAVDFAYREDADLEATGAPLGGYAQSKWVAEKLIAEAVRRGIPAAVYRPGVISGHSETGAWNHSDLLWGLARACFTLGKIPELAGRVDVVPVDYVSRAIVHLARQEAPDGRIYHLGNPVTYPYREMVDLVRGLGLPVDIVPFERWREALFRQAMDGSPDGWSAFLPIIEEVEVGQIFMPRFDSTNTLAGLAGSGITCPPVGPELLGRYLEFFNREGFFA